MKLIYVIEMLNNGMWEPTVGVGLTKNDAIKCLKNWSELNPDDKFRLNKYYRDEEDA